ncbi:MAG: hypothetical protein RBQ97_00570 [Acholeplasma sp.]|nr:hypothetical protein [Acholeplasma sp.]
MKVKQASQALVFLGVALFTLLATAFAWLTISKQSDISGIDSNITSLEGLVSFYVKKNNGQEIEIKTITDINTVFGETFPGDEYHFSIKINNTSKKEIDIMVSLRSFQAIFEEGFEQYSLLDVLYIENGTVERVSTNHPANLVLTPNDSTLVIKHNQELDVYRLSNLLTDGNLSLFPIQKIYIDELVSFNFTLIYDIDTEHVNYQKNSISFDGIYLYGQ